MEILCPSNGRTDESKFDLTLYTSLIQVMFQSKYDCLINDLRKYRNYLCHMGNKDMSDSEFKKEWNNACNKLQVHGFTETMHNLENGYLPPIEELRKIKCSLKRQIKGNV